MENFDFCRFWERSFVIRDPCQVLKYVDSKFTDHESRILYYRKRGTTCRLAIQFGPEGKTLAVENADLAAVEVNDALFH